MNARTDPAPAATVVEHAIATLRDHIRDGRLAEGQRLVIADVTRELGVSNGPVREAIRRLTGEGLVEITPHRGAAVRAFTGKDVREIFEVREVLEGLAARLAAERIDDAGRSRLVAVQREAKADAGAAYVAHNRSFHELIYDLSGNERVREQARQLTLPIYRRGMHGLMDPAHARSSALEHVLIVEAILQGDGAAAERAMRNHIRNSGAAMADAVVAEPERRKAHAA